MTDAAPRIPPLPADQWDPQLQDQLGKMLRQERVVERARLVVVDALALVHRHGGAVAVVPIVLQHGDVARELANQTRR